MSDQKRRTLSKSSDYLDTLAATLRDLGGPTTIPHELIQNADDAGNADAVRFVVSGEALTVWNNGTFTDCGEGGDACSQSRRCDLHAFRRFAGRTKAAEASTTGAFGVGFTSVYQITDAPELLYGDEHWILDEAASEHERLRACDGQCSRFHGQPGTTFVLPWARTASPLRERLEVALVTDAAIAEFERALVSDANVTVLFLRNIRRIELETSLGPGLVERDPEGNWVTVRDSVSSARWLMIEGDFRSRADELIEGANGLINRDRPSSLVVAIPEGGDVKPGFLYATLPTQTPSGLPAHVNATFYPSTDRKSVRFDTSDFHSSWNTAAVSGCAHAIGTNAAGIAQELGITPFWEFLGGITDQDRGAPSGFVNHSGTYLAAMRRVVPNLPVIETFEGARVCPNEATLPADTDIYEGAAALTKIGLRLVAQNLHRRLFTGAVYSPYGIELLTGRHVVTQLATAGLTHAFDPSIGPIDRGELLAILDVLERLPGNVANIDGVDGVSIVPCRGGSAAPGRLVVWPASENDAVLFELLVEDLVVADVDLVEQHCPGLKEVCTPLDVAYATGVLAGADPEALNSLSGELLDWLSRNLASITDRSTIDQVAALPIFPTASGSAPLTELSLPNNFRDPIGVATLVDESAALDYHKLLVALGAKPLNVVEYVSRHVLPAADDGRITSDQAGELLKVIAIHQEQLGDLREQLAMSPLVPCQDGTLFAAADVHMPSAEIALLAPNLPIAATGVASTILDWLGVQQAPNDEALSTAVERIANADAVAEAGVAEAVLLTLQARAAQPEVPPRFLTDHRWLPLRGGGRARPDEVLPTNQRQLYGTQGNELGLRPDLQARCFAQLTWLGMPASPPVATVVAHVKHCAANGVELNSDVYRVLSNNADQRDVKQLHATACIHVGQGRFVLPATAFWQQSPFGRWGTTLPEVWRPFKPFFDAVGVQDQPGPSEIAAVLRAILTEYGHDPVDSDGVDAVYGCWSRLSLLLEHPESSDVLVTLGRAHSALDPRGLLERPDELYFEDSRALHKRFPQLVNNVIPRVQGTWPALTSAGVRRVEELIKARVDDFEAAVDSELPKTIAERLSALRRVFDDSQLLDDLLELAILRAPEVRVSYRAELHGQPFEIGPESTDAVYLPDHHQLLYAEGASDRALARELARAMAPDDDPGPLAMQLEPILSAPSAAGAHSALDDFGIAQLDSTEHEAAWSPTAEVDDDDGQSDDSATDSPVESGEDDGTGDRGGPEGTTSAEPTDGDPTGGGGGSGGGTTGGAGGRKGSGSTTRTGRQTRLRSYVVDTDGDEGDRGTVGDEAPDLSPIDVAGVGRVLAYERSCGREPQGMAHNNAGFDVESYDKNQELVRRIEIKSTGRQWSIAGVMMSRRQHQQAVEDGELFWLYIVENALDDSYKIYRIHDPARRVDYFGFDDGWKTVSEPDVDRDDLGTPTAPSTRALLGGSPGQAQND